jgi:hypothetical protein
VFTSALTFYPLPSVFAALRRDRAEAEGEGGQERKSHSLVSGFANERPANPVTQIFKGAANDSPSPGGEGRGEGGCHSYIYNVVTVSEEPGFTPCHALKTSKNRLKHLPRASAYGSILPL